MRSKKSLKRIVAALVLAAVLTVRTSASTSTYASRWETNDTFIPDEYVVMIEEVCETYPIAPEFIEAIIEKESHGIASRSNSYGCVGLMQINPRWQQERMKRLGVSDLTDPYGNILVGTDYLLELFEEYEDPAEVLNQYGGWQGSQAGQAYIRDVLERSRHLEIVHLKIEAKG